MDITTDSATPRKMIGRASTAAAGTTYQQAVSFLSGLLIARVIGASDYGIFSLARNLVDVTGIVSRLGLEIGLQRYFGETTEVEARETRSAVLRRLRLIATALAVLPAAAVALGAGQALETYVYDYSGFANILLCLSLSLPFVTDIAVLGGAYRGTLRIGPSVIAESVLLPTARLLLVVILFLAGWRLWAVVVGTLAASIVASAFLWWRAQSDFAVGAQVARPPQCDVRRVLRYSIVLAAAVLVTTLASSMDILFLGHFASAPDLGQYSLVKMLLLLMGLFGAAFNQTLGAIVADRFFREDMAGLAQALLQSVRWITLSTTPVFAVFLLWGAELTPVFGASFAVSPQVVAVLATSQLIFVTLGPAGWALSMTGYHTLELKILVAGLIVAVTACAVLVPEYGQVGAAIAICVATAASNFARVLYVRIRIGILPFRRDIIAIIATGTFLALCSDYIIDQFSLTDASRTIAGIALFSAAYGIACWSCLLQRHERNGIRRFIAEARA